MRAAVVLALLGAAAPQDGKWTILTPDSVSSAGGATFTRQEDGSYLVSGNNPDKDTFTVVDKTELRGVTGFRLEALTDPSLPAQGPGRVEHGNIVLTEFKVQAGGKAVAIGRAAADFEQQDWPVAHTLDGKAETGWAVAPEFGKPHVAHFQLAAPADGPFTFSLEFQSPHVRHVIGRFRVSATTDKNPLRGLGGLPDDVQAILDLPAARRTDAQRTALTEYYMKRAEPAIRKGVEWLKTLKEYPRHDHVGGADELVLWTYVHAELPENDPAFEALFKKVMEFPLDRTYRVALRAMILEELDRVKHQGRIAACAQFLVDNQCANGQWSYGEPDEHAKEVTVQLPKDTATSGGVKVFDEPRRDRRQKPKVRQFIQVKKMKSGPGGGDNSNSQYACLGLRACFDAGIALPKDSIFAARKWWIESQNSPEGGAGGYAGAGWGYSGKDAQKSYGSMSAGAVGSIVICDHILDIKWATDPVARAGVNWLTNHFSVTENVRVGGGWYHYYLYGLERAGMLYGTERFGGHQWYPEGAEVLLKHQRPDGSWDGHAWNTCFAILFLKRATRPLEDVATEAGGKRK